MNLSSSSGKLTNTTEAAVYGATKCMILSVTRSFAYELAHVPVRVNAICPGIVDTPMQEKVLAEVAPLLGMTPDELSVARTQVVPLGRGSTPAEISGLIGFLLGPESGYMTGQSINHTGEAGDVGEAPHRPESHNSNHEPTRSSTMKIVAVEPIPVTYPEPNDFNAYRHLCLGEGDRRRTGRSAGGSRSPCGRRPRWPPPR